MTNKKKKILFLVDHRLDRSPGQRFRFEQYLHFLELNGYEYTISNLLNAKDDKLFYSPGNYLSKARIALKVILKRLNDVRRSREYDYIFIFRNAWFFGSILIEKWLRKFSSGKLVFDFDDAIWVPQVSTTYKKLSWLKSPDKTGRIISLCDVVIAGNEYLADYARQFNKNVVIIPTTIDTNEYQKQDVERNDNMITIGWSGSKSTVEHFKVAVPWLLKLNAKYGGKFRIVVIGDKSYHHPELPVIAKDWKKEDELKELSAFDIGIMPLPDDDWSRGKCGLKGLQYMALGIPTLMSPVGVNKEIIQDGENGFLASEDHEWIEKVSMLMESKTLRDQIGEAGRQTVVKQFSVEANKHAWLRVFSS